MKIPRDLNGKDLASLLAKYGYRITRQTGSHIRLTTIEKGEHHITIPDHNYLKIGTLNNILSDLSTHLNMDKRSVIADLFVFLEQLNHCQFIKKKDCRYTCYPTDCVIAL